MFAASFCHCGRNGVGQSLRSKMTRIVAPGDADSGDMEGI